MRVLVIGASFGGLTVANRLLQVLEENQDGIANIAGRNDSQAQPNQTTTSPLPVFQVDILDALYPPSKEGGYVGTICVPAAQELLKGLGKKGVEYPQSQFSSSLADKQHYTTRTDTNIFSREALLNVLRQNVPVKYSHAVTELQHDKSDNHWWATVTIRSQSTTVDLPDHKKQREEEKWGPYHAVIVANGPRSQFPLKILPAPMQYSQPNTIKNHPLLWAVGDACYTRWWDLGRQRIRQGANQAMLDGWELGTQLQRALKLRREQCNPHQDVSHSTQLLQHALWEAVPRKFRLNCGKNRSLLRLFSILLVVVIGISLQFKWDSM